MKNRFACTVAALLLTLTIAGTIANGRYVKSTANHILHSLDELPGDVEDSVASIEELAEYWNGHRAVLNLALSDPDLDLISSLFDELLIGAEEGNEEEYKKSMARLRRAIDDIKRLEEFSIENIF